MKRCPECRRDYYDDTLLYCLDDGNALLEGPGTSESPTMVLAGKQGLPKPDRNLARTGDGREIEDQTTIANLTALNKPLSPPEGTGAKRKRVVWAASGTCLVIFIVIAAWKFGAFTTQEQSRPNQTDAGSANKPPNSVAYENYVRAKVLLMTENRDETDNAIKLLEEAVSQDPDYAPAWAVLARARSIMAFYFAASAERKQFTENAEVAVARALAIDPNLAEAHFARGLLLWTHAKRFPHEQAIQSYKRALELDPNMDEAHHQLAVIYFHLGLFEKALAEIRKTLEINPGNTLARFRFGVIDMYRGNYEDAYAYFKSTPLEKNPSLHAFQSATALFKLGRSDEALDLIEKYLHDYPNDEGGVGNSVKAMILANNGNVQNAEEAIRRAEEIGKDYGHYHHTAYNIASAYAIMNQADRAIDYLQLAADDGFPCYPLFASDENLKSLRQDPRFVTFLAKSKQQWERYNATL